MTSLPGCTCTSNSSNPRHHRGDCAVVDPDCAYKDERRYKPECKCPDPYCPEHAVCPHDGSKLIILEGDPAFCEVCEHDVMPKNACGNAR